MIAKARRIALSFFIVSTTIFIFTTFAGTVINNRNLIDKLEKIQKNNTAQSIGHAVANCATQNIIRDSVQNMLTRFELSGDFSPKGIAAIKESRTEFMRVDCKAFAPKDDQLKIKLDYPTTIPVP